MYSETRIDLTTLNKADGTYCTSCGIESKDLYNPNKQEYKSICRGCLDTEYRLGT